MNHTFSSDVVLKEHAFTKYERPAPTAGPEKAIPERLQQTVRLLSALVADTYHRCNAAFHYSAALNPRRILTKPSEGVSNDGYDNVNADYILKVNDILTSNHGQRYVVLELLGEGTFGQVVKCQNLDSKEVFAIKIIKNKPAYYNQAVVEVHILHMLNRYFDPEDKHHIARLVDAYMFRGHLCIVCELLNVNLYELLKQNKFHGLSIKLLRSFVAQMLDCLALLNEAKVIHCDLKPENILLKNLHSPHIKIIDFGSACFEGQTVYMYIQSRFYRSPEVLLGLPYSSSIDVWSVGCIAAELFLGLPLFPGCSEFNQMCRIVDMLGKPPDHMLSEGKTSSTFFRRGPGGPQGSWVLKTAEEFAKDNNLPVETPKKYFNFRTLEEIIDKYPHKRTLTEAQLKAERESRRAFLHFLTGILQLDPHKRWTAQEALNHPFVTGALFSGDWTPPPREGQIGPYSARSRPRAIQSSSGHPRQQDRSQQLAPAQQPSLRWLGDPQSAPLASNQVAAPHGQRQGPSPIGQDPSRIGWTSGGPSHGSHGPANRGPGRPLSDVQWSLESRQYPVNSFNNPINPALPISRSVDGGIRTSDERGLFVARGALIHVAPSGQPIPNPQFGSPSPYVFDGTPIPFTPPQRARNRQTIHTKGPSGRAGVAHHTEPPSPSHHTPGSEGQKQKINPVTSPNAHVLRFAAGAGSGPSPHFQRGAGPSQGPFSGHTHPHLPQPHTSHTSSPGRSNSPTPPYPRFRRLSINESDLTPSKDHSVAGPSLDRPRANSYCEELYSAGQFTTSASRDFRHRDKDDSMRPYPPAPDSVNGGAASDSGGLTSPRVSPMVPPNVQHVGPIATSSSSSTTRHNPRWAPNPDSALQSTPEEDATSLASAAISSTGPNRPPPLAWQPSSSATSSSAGRWATSQSATSASSRAGPGYSSPGTAFGPGPGPGPLANQGGPGVKVGVGVGVGVGAGAGPGNPTASRGRSSSMDQQDSDVLGSPDDDLLFGVPIDNDVPPPTNPKPQRSSHHNPISSSIYSPARPQPPGPAIHSAWGPTGPSPNGYVTANECLPRGHWRPAGSEGHSHEWDKGRVEDEAHDVTETGGPFLGPEGVHKLRGKPLGETDSAGQPHGRPNGMYAPVTTNRHSAQGKP